MKRNIARRVEKRRGLFYPGVLLFLLILAGCASINDLSRETYRKGFLKVDRISKEEIAVLPMTGDANTAPYLLTARGIFNDVMTEMRPQMRPSEPLPVAPQNEVLEESAFASLKKTTRFLLQTELNQVEVVEGATQIQVHGRLWDVQLGEVIWEGVGESRGHLFLFFPEAPASFEKAMEVATRGFIRKMPIQ